MNYTKKDLAKIFECIVLFEELPDKYQEILPIKNSLFYIFSEYKHWISKHHLDIDTTEEWQFDFIKSSIYNLLYGEYKDYLNEDLTEIISLNLDYFDKDIFPSNDLITDRIRLIFNPKEVSLKSHLYFINGFYGFIDVLFWLGDQEFQFKYDKFNDLYNVIRCLPNLKQIESKFDLNIIATILIYCYLNDIRDYAPVFEYVNNKSYYLEFLLMNGVNMNELSKKNYDELDSGLLYNLIEIKFKYDNRTKIIK